MADGPEKTGNKALDAFGETLKAIRKPLTDFRKLLTDLRKPLTDLKRSLARMELNVLRICFEKDGNSLFAVHAFGIARKNNFDIPTWVMEYIDGAFGNLLTLADDPPKKDPGLAAAKAIGLMADGSGSMFRRYKEVSKQLHAACRVQQLLDGAEYDNENNNTAYLAVGMELNVSTGTVRNWYERFKGDLGKPLN